MPDQYPTQTPPSSDAEAQQDRNFDDLAERFQNTIYATPRGQLRLMALTQDFDDLIGPVQGKTVLDIGGGQGQFSLSLAQQGADIVLTDISAEMLALAADQFAAEQLLVRIEQVDLQNTHKVCPGVFDIVLNHAVLEWLQDPISAIQILCNQVAPDGWLSLMFYNLHGHQWRQLMNGRTHAPDGANPTLRKAGNSPQHPLDPAVIEQALQAQGFQVQRWRGIRCVHDHMHQKIRDRIGQEAVNHADLEFGLQQPYRQLGRYVHFLARRNTV